MRIYIFKSDANRELRAFAGDIAVSRLPEHSVLGTWSAR
jgi:hypothetical protein